MNDHRHYHTESERRQLDGAVTDSDMNGWNTLKTESYENPCKQST